MSQRNDQTERRIKAYTKITCREQNDFMRGRECIICSTFAPYDSRREWNRHLAMHERDKIFTKEQHEQYIQKLIEEDEQRLDIDMSDSINENNLRMRGEYPLKEA